LAFLAYVGFKCLVFAKTLFDLCHARKATTLLGFASLAAARA
jgi:hypothetical protein